MHTQVTAQSSGRFLKRALVLLPLAAWVQLAAGEGAVRTFDCTITQTCNAAGRCEKAAGEVTFRMSPEALAADGSGTYQINYRHGDQINYRDVQASVKAASYAGPFYWNTNSERNSLLASSETEFLWHRLILAPTPETEIHFLSCMLTN